MHSIRVAHRVRRWLQITPEGAAGSKVPILVMLGGINATVTQELDRDGFVPHADAGKVELVYPVGIGESWNAGDCCGEATTEHVDDVGFISTLASLVDPAHLRPLYLVGFSDGGRLAYAMACTDPSVFTSLAVVEAVPDYGCNVTKPLAVLQVDGTKDEWVPYEPPETDTRHRRRPPSSPSCARPTAAASPSRRLAVAARAAPVAHCTPGAEVEFATYIGLGHDWFPGSASTPAVQTVIWDFLTGVSLAAVSTSSASP